MDENLISMTNIFDSGDSSSSDDFEMIEIDDSNDENNIEKIEEDVVEDNKPIFVSDKISEKTLKEEKKDKRIERIQVFLIVFLVISASLFYFFGYDFIEPYIKID